MTIKEFFAIDEWVKVGETIKDIYKGLKSIFHKSIKIRKMKKELKRRGIDWKEGIIMSKVEISMLMLEDFRKKRMSLEKEIESLKEENEKLKKDKKLLCEEVKTLNDAYSTYSGAINWIKMQYDENYELEEIRELDTLQRTIYKHVENLVDKE